MPRRNRVRRLRRSSVENRRSGPSWTAGLALGGIRRGGTRPIEAELHRDPDRRFGLSRRGRLRGQGHPYAAHRLPGPQRHAVYQRLLGLPGVHPGACGALDRALPAALRPGMGDFSRSEDGEDAVRPGRSRKDARRPAARTGVCHGGLGKVAPGRSTAVLSHQAGLRLLLRLPAMGPLLSQSHPGGACASDRPLDLVVQVPAAARTRPAT